MTDIEEKIISTLRGSKRRFALTVPFLILWGLFIAAWFAALDPDRSFRGELLVFALPAAILCLAIPRLFARNSLAAERAMRSGGDPNAWYRAYLDRQIREKRWIVWLTPVAALVMAWAQWEVHAPGTERRFAAGVAGLVIFVVALTWSEVADLRRLRRERASSEQ